MNSAELQEAITNEPLPIILEFWAPWCGPCRVMRPNLERIAQAYEGQVSLQKVNVDEFPDLARSLKVQAVPTLLVFQHGNLEQRLTGVQDPVSLERLFRRLASGEAIASTQASSSMTSLARFMRLSTGMILVILAIWLQSWPLAAVGSLIAFWGWYDRCPIWQAIAPRIIKIFTGS